MQIDLDTLDTLEMVLVAQPAVMRMLRAIAEQAMEVERRLDALENTTEKLK